MDAVGEFRLGEEKGGGGVKGRGGGGQGGRDPLLGAGGGTAGAGGSRHSALWGPPGASLVASLHAMISTPPLPSPAPSQ